jgi:hypothetical protein
VFYFNGKNEKQFFSQNSNEFSSMKNEFNLIGCNNLEIDDVWTVGLPKLNTESAFRLVDVNSDGVLDVIFGFGTG